MVHLIIIYLKFLVQNDAFDINSAVSIPWHLAARTVRGSYEGKAKTYSSGEHFEQCYSGSPEIHTECIGMAH